MNRCLTSIAREDKGNRRQESFAGQFLDDIGTIELTNLWLIRLVLSPIALVGLIGRAILHADLSIAIFLKPNDLRIEFSMVCK